MLSMSARLCRLLQTHGGSRHTRRHVLLYSTDLLPDRQKDIEAILKGANEVKAKKWTACDNVIKLAKLNTSEDEMTGLLKDERFDILIKLLEADVRDCKPLNIISCLKALKDLGVRSDSLAVRNLENAFVWLARTCTIRELVMGFQFTLKRQESESQKKTFREICAAMERRWVEIQDGKLFVPLFLNFEKLTPQLMTKLEDRVQDCVEDMSVADLVNILVVFGKTRRRNMPVLRSLGFHIAKNRTFLDVKQISNVLFAYNKLNFKDPDTLERICSSLELLVESTQSPAVLSSILSSLGRLKFTPPTVLDMICDWYDKRLVKDEALSSRELISLLRTLAILNYSTIDKHHFMQRLIGKLRREDINDKEWLEVVWSLVALNRATAEHVASVLNPNFLKNLLESESGLHSIMSSKLLSINAAAQLILENYTGPLLNITEESWKKEFSVLPSQEKLKLRKFVFETLTTLFPKPRFLSEDVRTGLGMHLDAQLIVDSNVKPLQVEPYSSDFTSKATPKELPKGAHKIAVLITPFQECLLGGGQTGMTALDVKLIKAQGYTPLVIDNRTIDSTMKTVNRVQKIDVLVKQAVGRNI